MPWAEMADGGRRRARIGLDDDGVVRGLAVPHREKARIAQNLPPIGIGDVEREAAIGVALVGCLHPVALDGRGANIDVVAVDDMGDELHVVPGFKGRRRTPP
jgi:hypothetical protein